MMRHGFRGTVVSRIFEAGYSDASVDLRSGQRAHRSFAAYQNPVVL